jgi:hypothetical protein
MTNLIGQIVNHDAKTGDFFQMNDATYRVINSYPWGVDVVTLSGVHNRFKFADLLDCNAMYCEAPVVERMTRAKEMERKLIATIQQEMNFDGRLFAPITMEVIPGEVRIDVFQKEGETQGFYTVKIYLIHDESVKTVRLANGLDVLEDSIAQLLSPVVVASLVQQGIDFYLQRVQAWSRAMGKIHSLEQVGN